MAVVGGSSLVAAVTGIKMADGSQLSTILAGVVMLVWTIGEMASIRGFHFSQVMDSISGAAVMWCTPYREVRS